MSDKAVLFGINRYERISNLRGCVNDVKNVRTLLTEVFGFAAQNVRAQTDEDVTKKEINKRWKWLIKDASAGDRLVFHFSGHGSYTRDEDGDETEDGVDELLCLYGMDWGDRDSYLLDDDLREMTDEIPSGVNVTFLLDCCHSGTGTRALYMPDEADDGNEAKLPVVDVETSVTRLSVDRGLRSLAVGDEQGVAEIRRVLAPQSSQDAQRTILARFVPPPPGVARQLRRDGVRRALVAMGDEGMNHVLFSGSRSDQTSADAYIQGDYHGAFTYHFCEAVRNAEGRIDHQNVIDQVRSRLLTDHFTQVPQLEPKETQGPLFHRSASTSEPEGDSASATSSGAANQDAVVLTLLRRIVELLESRAATVASPRPATAGRHLVYVHGICRHDAGYSNDWWAALKRHLAPPLASELRANRHEVLWSDIVSPTRAFPGIREPVDTAEQKTLTDSIRAILNDRVERQVVEQAPEQPPAGRPVAARMAIDRAAFGVPGLNCVDDFTKYLLSDSIRDQVLDAFSFVVEPLLRQGATIDIISHSWGTVVAYEGLRRLEGSGLSGSVKTLFTVGSALSIGPVRSRLLWRDGARPAYVRQWVNLDAKGDIVGGPLEPHGFAVDSEYLGLHPTGCGSFAGIVAPACAHGSYFHSDNRAVNNGIFARHMER